MPKLWKQNKQRQIKKVLNKILNVHEYKCYRCHTRFSLEPNVPMSQESCPKCHRYVWYKHYSTKCKPRPKQIEPKINRVWAANDLYTASSAIKSRGWNPYMIIMKPQMVTIDGN